MSAAVPLHDDPTPLSILALVRTDRAEKGPCRAETAECTCPEFCERDHDRD